MTDEELTEYRNRTNAKIAALHTAVIVLLKLHPHKDVLAAALDRYGEHLLGQWLNSPLPDVFVDQYQRDLEALKKHLQSD